MPSHDFNHDHAVVGFGRGVQTVNAFRSDIERGIVAESVIGRIEVIVDGFRNADDFEALVEKLGSRAERIFAADRDQSAQPVLVKRAFDFIQRLLVFTRVGPRSSKGRSALGRMPETAWISSTMKSSS